MLLNTLDIKIDAAGGWLDGMDVATCANINQKVTAAAVVLSVYWNKISFLWKKKNNQTVNKTFFLFIIHFVLDTQTYILGLSWHTQDQIKFSHHNFSFLFRFLEKFG